MPPIYSPPLSPQPPLPKGEGESFAPFSRWEKGWG